MKDIRRRTRRWYDGIREVQEKVCRESDRNEEEEKEEEKERQKQTEPTDRTDKTYNTADRERDNTTRRGNTIKRWKKGVEMSRKSNTNRWMRKQVGEITLLTEVQAKAEDHLDKLLEEMEGGG